MRMLALASLVLMIGGCGAAPSGRTGQVPQEVLDAPIAAEDDVVVVRPVALLDASGGVYLNVAVEGPREKAVWVAKCIADDEFSRKSPGNLVLMADREGAIALDPARTPPPPWPIATVQYAHPTRVVMEDRGMVRTLLEIGLRCREPDGDIKVELSEPAIRASFAGRMNDESYVQTDSGMQRFVRPEALSLRVEPASLRLIPQPGPRVRSINSYNER